MKKRILSLLLVGAAMISLFTGCGKATKGEESISTNSSEKVEVVREDAFETIPENALIPEFIKSRYVNNDELLKDYRHFYIAMWCADKFFTEEEQAVLDKYGLSRDVSTLKESYDKNPEFYEGAINYVMTTRMKDVERVPYMKELIVKAQDYLANTLLDEQNELDLSKEFKELNPEAFVKKYLKSNKIEIINVVFPQDLSGIFFRAGTTILSLEVTIEGEQDGIKFSKTKMYDFHFAASEDIRTGSDLRVLDNAEIMAVTDTGIIGVQQYNMDIIIELF